MEFSRRNAFIYGLLAAAWLLVLGWQSAEHLRVRRTTRTALSYRAKDISTTLGIVLRSQRRFGGIVSKERIESALNDLVKLGDVQGIALLSAASDVIASAGTLPDTSGKSGAAPAENWDGPTVTVMSLVDLGTNVTSDIEGSTPPIVLPREEFFHSTTTNRLAAPLAPPRPLSTGTNFAPSLTITGTAAYSSPTPTPRSSWPHFPRPRWMSEDEYHAMLHKQGVHSFRLALSAEPVRAACAQDLWLRLIIGGFATVAALGSGLAWRNLSKSAELQLRLVRASELNTHLKEMNLAAAGLAHETRNPLNIIRGLAQMISKQPAVTGEIPAQSRAILDEVDKVTVQLNEFINYSRPREVRRSTVVLPGAINEVVRALRYDLDEKQVQLTTDGEPLTIDADEQLLRQALFNLLMNAIQAVSPGGAIRIITGKQTAVEGWLEIRDNGSGVLPERRSEIFKPYVTTNQTGTGLGLAVVQQIMLLHGWEITCLPTDPHGATFRITHLKLVTKS